MNKLKPIDINSPEYRANAERRRRTWTATAYRDLDAMKMDEYAYWQSQPAHVRLTAATEMTIEQYAMKGIDARRLQRTVGGFKHS